MRKNNLTKNEIKLIEFAIPYLKIFLSEMDGFYPFAAVMDNSGEIYSLEPDINEEFPNAQYLIELYKTGFEIEYKKEVKDYILAIICIDEIINEDNSKYDAVQVYIMAPDYNKIIHIKYKKTSQGIIFNELY